MTGSPAANPSDGRRRASFLLLGAAMVAEVAAWATAGDVPTETFAWFRVQGHLGVAGFVAAAAAGLAGLAATAAWARTERPPWAMFATLLVVFGLHAAFVGMPQGHPDTVSWFTLAQAVEQSPISAVIRWPATAWATEEARFHHPFPLVPTVFGWMYALFGESPAVSDLTLTGWAAALGVATAWAFSESGKPALGAALLASSWPLLGAISGWLLADLPLVTLTTLAWGAMRRATTAPRAAVAALAAIPALLTKGSAVLFLVGPAAAMVLGSPAAILGAGAAGFVALLAVYPPRVHEMGTYLHTVTAIGIHLRPAAFFGLAGGSRLSDRDRALGLGIFGVLPVLVLFSPPEHAARYALPLVPTLAWLVARTFPHLGGFLFGSGVVLMLGGYRPIVVHHQSANIQLATDILEAAGATGIEVWSDMPQSGFGVASVAALVDYESGVPVRIGGELARTPAGSKRHWWEFHAAPPWHAAGAANTALVAHYGTSTPGFDARGWTKLQTVSLYRASSLLHPASLDLYLRTPE